MSKISELPAAAALDGDELIPVVQDGGTARVAVSVLADAIGDRLHVVTEGVAMTLGEDAVRQYDRYGHVWERALPDQHSMFYGRDAGNLTMTSQCCLGVGTDALSSLTSGGHNIGIGYRSLASATESGSNVFIGSFSGELALTIIDTVAIGFGALRTATAGIGGVAIGMFALEKALNAGNNTAVGDSALRYTTTGQQNVAVGYTCADQNLTGSYNVYMGQGAAFARVQGDYNVLIGYRSGADAVLAGNRNVGLGVAALEDHVGHDMVAVGQEAGRGTTTAGGCVFVGFRAGRQDEGQKLDAVNAVAIGSGAVTTEDNMVVLGNASILKTHLRGRVIVNPTAAVAASAGRVDVHHAKSTLSNPADGALVLTDPTPATAGVGGSLVFRGAYTGTTVTEAAAIQAVKSNAVSGQFGFNLAFHTRTNGGGNSEKVIILSSGETGFGTSLPAEKVHVVGNIKLTGVIRFGPLTVATLPVVANEGDFTQVSDALTPAWRTPPTGGGAESLNVIYSGGQWLAA